MHTNTEQSAIHNIELATAAKIFGIGRNKLYAILKDLKILNQDCSPTQQMIREGYFTTTVSHYRKPGCENRIDYYQKPIVTAKGTKFLRELLREVGVLIEKDNTDAQH